jgi:hypothetical protein
VNPSFFFSVYDSPHYVNLFPVCHSLALIFGSLPGCITGAIIGDKYEKKSLLVKGYLAAIGPLFAIIFVVLCYFI